MPEPSVAAPSDKSFVLRSPNPPAFQFRLSRPTIVVGRAGRCDLVLFDPSVSRDHAQIHVGRTELHVFDLKSSNGTFVDDQRIETSTVRRGQTIKFGNSAFVVALEDHAAADEETDAPAIADLGTIRTDAMQALRGRLSKAQIRVFDLLLTGSADKVIAAKLSISHHTVHNHIQAIFRAFNIHSRGELLATVIETCRTMSTSP